MSLATFGHKISFVQSYYDMIKIIRSSAFNPYDQDILL